MGNGTEDEFGRCVLVDLNTASFSGRAVVGNHTIHECRGGRGAVTVHAAAAAGGGIAPDEAIADFGRGSVAIEAGAVGGRTVSQGKPVQHGSSRAGNAPTCVLTVNHAVMSRSQIAFIEAAFATRKAAVQGDIGTQQHDLRTGSRIDTRPRPHRRDAFRRRGGIQRIPQ